MAKRKTSRIRVLLVDDHPVVRDGVRSSLAAAGHLEVVGEAADGEEALRKVKALSPDVVLMDISMPKMGGLEAMKQMQKIAPGTRVIILSMHDSKEYIRQVVRSGAHGYVLKDIHPGELIHAIEAVHRGETFFSPTVSRVIVDDYREGGRDEPMKAPSQLSRREKEVLCLIAEGCANKEIADQLFVTVRTIETHRERIMRKLNIHNVAGLTKFAIANGIVKLE